MKKFLALLLAVMMTATLFSFAASAETADSALLAEAGLEVGPDGAYRFIDTRKITVEIFDRGLDNGKTPAYDNKWTQWIHDSLLAKHNIEVEYQPVDRWTEVDQLNNLLAAGDAPDVCVTYDYSTIQNYAKMGGVIDLAEYVDKYASVLPNLWGWLGESNMYWDKDPATGSIWALEAKLAVNTRINTFVRQDWLEKLGMAEPTTLEEFETMLRAFKDNAELLLGDEADKMVPFSLSQDVGWRNDHLVAAFIPETITDKDIYVYGFDDRHLMFPGYKEAVRKLNEWYNEGLIWPDFALYGDGDSTEDNMFKAGYIGSMIHNWDLPYRDGDNGITGNLHKLVGPDANYMAVTAFQNEVGLYKKFLSAPIDRKVFLTGSNDEPLASLLYLDFVSDADTVMFLQVGEEGKTHKVLEDGTIQNISGQEGSDPEWIQNSLNNIDYTITINGLNLGGDMELTLKSISTGYAGVDAALIAKAYDASLLDGRIGKHAATGEVEEEIGMSNPLAEKRDVMLCNAIIAKPEDFDNVWDSAWADYLASGAQAIIDGRLAAWEAVYGEETMLP
ncbi:MAG: extracellular solute-binding protein [Oscillospiraceae bacterium]|jgi:putative aldouronate transport system substrate-binding protein|nr:extracellular solute-binding protein [Oscillospiraceae bacterium]